MIRPDDFRQHTTCMTEVERYEKKGAQASKTKSTKKSPQEIWTELLSDSVDVAPSHLKNHLRTLASLGNAPRKEKQFRNFAANSLGLRGNNNAIVGDIWNFLKEVKEKQQKERSEVSKAATLTEKEEPFKAQAPEEKEAEKSDKEASNPTKKEVKKAMKKVLKANSNKLKMKELRKKVQTQLALPKSLKGDLKRLIQQTVETKESFVVEGKVVMLAS